MIKSTKIIASGAALAAVGIVCVSVAVSNLNSSALDTVDDMSYQAFKDVEIPQGRYMFNGDSDSEYWIDVTPETITVCGPDIEGEVYKNFKEETPDQSEEILRETAKNSVQEFLQPNEYRSVQADGVDFVNVFVDWVEEDGLISGYGFWYEDDVINWGIMGDFVLES